MNNNNTVSVIIPAYNAEQFIAETINSALSQTSPAYEIIVIDDGSTDNTAKIVSKFKAPVNLIQQPNKGVSAARNTGIRNATGDFIAFLDADDLWTPNKLEKQLEFFTAQPEVSTVITDELYFVDNHKIIVDSYLNKASFSSQLPKEPSILKTPVTWLFTQSFVATSSVVCRKNVLDKAGFFDESMSICEDRDMWIRLAFEAPIGLIPEVMIHKRQEHGGNLSNINREGIIKGIEIVLSRYEKKAYQAIRNEGEKPNKVYAENYKRFADFFWYKNNISYAKCNYYKSFKKGNILSIIKFSICALGYTQIDLLRKIKGYMT